MEDFKYVDDQGDFLDIEEEVDGRLTLGVGPGDVSFINVEATDAPGIALALLERAGYKIGGPSFADAALGALKDHVVWEQKNKANDVKVKKYFKEVRKIDLDRVQDRHREEFKRLQDFNDEVFGRLQETVPYEDRMKADPWKKWRTQELGTIHFVFEYDHKAGRWDCVSSATGSKKEPYDGTLFNLSHSYFPLEEVLD